MKSCKYSIYLVITVIPIYEGMLHNLETSRETIYAWREGMYEYLNEHSTVSEWPSPVIHPKEERKQYSTPTPVYGFLLPRILKVGICS